MGAVIMNTAQDTISCIEAIIDSAKSAALASGKSKVWDRDKTFIALIREKLASKDRNNILWVLDQMRNLSQGFGSYVADLHTLDRLLDALYLELQMLVTDKTPDVH